MLDFMVLSWSTCRPETFKLSFDQLKPFVSRNSHPKYKDIRMSYNSRRFISPCALDWTGHVVIYDVAKRRILAQIEIAKRYTLGQTTSLKKYVLVSGTCPIF